MFRVDETASLIRELYQACWRHRRRAIGVFAGIMVLVVIALVVWPRKYRSEGRLFVRLGRESVTLDPIATTGQTISVSEPREIEINSIVQILSSRAMAEKVVDVLGPEVVLGKRNVADADDEDARENDSQANSASHVKKSKLHQDAVKEVANGIRVNAPEKSTVISVQYDGGSPELAQKIVGTLMEAYLAEHVRVNRTPGSHEFFLQQSRLFDNELKRNSEQLRDAKNNLGIASIDGHRQILQTQIGTVEAQIIETQSQLEAAKARAAALEATIADMPERMLTQQVTGIANSATDSMRQRLYELQIREHELLSKYTEDHPQVLAIRVQVAEAKDIMAAQEPERMQSTSAVNPSRQQLEVALLTERANVDSWVSRGDELRQQRSLLRDELRELNTQEIMIAQLERKVQLAEANYRTYADKLEQARIDQALESQRISNVNIVQPATFVSRPISPNKTLVLALGLILATAGAYGVVMLSEQNSRPIRSADEIEQELNLPVLMTIPRFASDRTLRN